MAKFNYIHRLLWLYFNAHINYHALNECIIFNNMFYIGMMAGAYIWGSLADALGRRKVLIVISFMNALCIVASTFAQSYGVFMFFRFLNGAA